MKYRFLLLIVLMTALFSCIENESSPLVEDDNLNAEMLLSPLFNYSGNMYSYTSTSKNTANSVTKKLKLRNSGTITFVPNSPLCDSNIQIIIQGKGNASHLGLFTIEIAYCSDGINPLGPILGTQTAANGDQLFTALVGAGFDEDYGNYMDFIYYGGTGRFSNASGNIRLFGLVDYDNQVFDLQGSGIITY